MISNNLNFQKLDRQYNYREETVLHQNSGFNVIKGFQQTENGEQFEKIYLDYPQAVCMLAFPSPKSIFLVRQYRYPVDEWTLEIPAGKMENEDQNAEKAAERELAEETGFLPGKLTYLTSFYPAASYSNEILHLYQAEELRKTEEFTPDADEILELKEMSLKEVKSMIINGLITDAKTILSVLFYIQNQKK